MKTIFQNLKGSDKLLHSKYWEYNFYIILFGFFILCKFLQIFIDRFYRLVIHRF